MTGETTTITMNGGVRAGLTSGRGPWDVVVIGAGPAGAMAACALARLGAAVLLLDRAAFPRDKVCGCCINRAAAGQLAEAGLGDLLHRCRSRRIDSVRLYAGERSARLRVPPLSVVSRRNFDHALVRSAVAAGVRFVPRASAALGRLGDGCREIAVRTQGDLEVVRARVVIAADGVAGRLLDESGGSTSVIAPRARIGVATQLNDLPPWFDVDSLAMACGRHGYVGMVRLEDGRLDVAAALDPAAMRRAGGAAAAVSAILASAGRPAPAALDGARWRGTPPLTRSPSRVAAERLFAIGDAAGYVEPFTGEGIAWALATGRGVAPIVADAARDRHWQDESARRWTRRHESLLSRRHGACGRLSALLRHPRLTTMAIAALGVAPVLASPVIGAINRGPKADGVGVDHVRGGFAS